MLYELIQRKWPLDEIRFNDCGLELPETHEWISYIEKKLGVEIKQYKSSASFDELFYKVRTKGKNAGKIWGFPLSGRRGCWISSDVKLKAKNNGPNEIIYIGICADEKERSTPKPNIIYPLVEWGFTQADVVKRLEELDLVPPIYKLGFKRNGCWLCPKQSTRSLKLLRTLHPDLWERLLKYEADSPWGFRDKSSRHISAKELDRRWKIEDAGGKVNWYGWKRSERI